jgi:hypothetical protein
MSSEFFREQFRDLAATVQLVEAPKSPFDTSITIRGEFKWTTRTSIRFWLSQEQERCFGSKKGLPTTCAGGDCPDIRKHGDRVYSQIVELKERSLEFRANSAFQNRMAVGAQIDSMNQVRETQASFRTQESES